jgi:hypothetical protein
MPRPQRVDAFGSVQLKVPATSMDWLSTAHWIALPRRVKLLSAALGAPVGETVKDVGSWNPSVPASASVP